MPRSKSAHPIAFLALATAIALAGFTPDRADLVRAEGHQADQGMFTAFMPALHNGGVEVEHPRKAPFELADVAHVDAQVHLPVLGQKDGCDTWIAIQNVGSELSKAVLVQWGLGDPLSCGAGCAGPSRVECSGLIAPGGVWFFSHPRGGLMPSASASIYSFTAKLLSEIGVDIGFDDVVADLMCETLFFGVIGDCEDFQRFKRAFDGGLEFAGVPLDRARGSPLAVHVTRRCPGTGGEATYSGIPASIVGVPGDDGRFLTVAPSVHRSADHTTVLFVQNVGHECASLEWWARQISSCTGEQLCSQADLGPGETLRIDVAECVEIGFSGLIAVHSTQPIAMVVESGDEGSPGWSAYEGVPGYMADESGAPAQAGGTVLFGPVLQSENSGWSTAVYVHNQDPGAAAKVRVTFLDRDGVITTLVNWICARGSQFFLLPAAGTLSGRWYGWVRVESEEWMPNPPRLSGIVHALQSNGPGQSVYNLTPEHDAFLWPDGSDAGGTASGVGLIAVPLASTLGGCAAGGAAERCGEQVDLVVTNVVQPAGVTDYVISFFDDNGHVASSCHQLAAEQVAYFDLGALGHLTPNFRGSAVISATSWRHPVANADGSVARNVVGLMAAAVARSGEFNHQGGVTNGIPLRGEAASDLAATLSPPPCPAEAPAVAPAPLAAGRLPIPHLKSGGDDACVSLLSVQNLSASGSFVAVVGWGPPGPCPDCPAPVAVACSAELAVGGSAVVQLPAGMMSGIAYSLSSADPAGACAALSTALVAECESARRFDEAYVAGASFAQFDVDALPGGPIGGDVQRFCSAPDPGFDAVALMPYASSTGDHRYALPRLLVGPDSTSVVNLQNVSSECATAELWVVGSTSCGDAKLCGSASVAPGQTATLSAEACLAVDAGDAAGWIVSDQPLAIEVAFSGAQADATYEALAWPEDAAGASTILHGPLAFSAFQGWTTEVSVQNVGTGPALVTTTFLDQSGAILETFTGTVCPGGSGAFLLAASDGLPGNWVGQVHVESQPHVDRLDGTLIPAAPIQGVVVLHKSPTVDSLGSQGTVAYRLLDGASFSAPYGHGGGGLGSGAGLIAVPGVASDEMSSSMIGIANLVPVPGATRVTVALYDASGLVDHLCLELHHRQVQYVDLRQLGGLPTGFRGSAIISAGWWEHPASAGGQERNLVGLGAVVVHQAAGLGPDVLAATTGQPLWSHPGLFDGGGLPVCPEGQ